MEFPREDMGEKKGIVGLFLVCIIAFVFVSLVSATDYYVSSSEGDNANNGLTTVTPWKNTSTINTKLFSTTFFNPGDNIYFKRGDTWYEKLGISDSGNITNNLTFGAYGTGNGPIFDGNSTGAERTTLIDVNSQNYIVVENIELINATIDGFQARGTSHNITVRNVKSTFSKNQAFQLEDNASAIYYNIEGSDCLDDGFSMHDNTFAIIYNGTFNRNSQGINYINNATITGHNLTILNSTLSSIAQTDGDELSGRFYNIIANMPILNTISSGTVAGYMELEDVYMENIYEEAHSGFVGYGVMSEGPMNITNLTVINSSASAIYAEAGADINITRSLFDTETSYHILDAKTGSRVSVSYSIFRDAGSGKYCTVARAGSTVELFNNVFYAGDNLAKGVYSTVDGTNTTNNIFYGLAVGVYTQGDITQIVGSNNLFSSNTDDGLADATLTNSITGYDPLFVDAESNNFRLINSNSQAIDNGTVLDYSLDYYGSPIFSGSTSDIGISEYDLTSPLISENSTSLITINSAVINWTTDELSNSSVNYGVSESLGNIISNSSNVTAHSLLLSVLSSGILYYFQIETCDENSNCNSTNGTFTTVAVPAEESVVESQGGGPLAGIWTRTYMLNHRNMQEVGEIVRKIKENERIQIRLEEEKHYIGVSRFSLTSLLVTVSSEPQEKILLTGEESKFDITDDKIYDLKIKLNEIDGNWANISIKYIHEEIPSKEKTKGIAKEPSNELRPQKSNQMLYIGIAITLVILIISSWLVIKINFKK